MSSLAWMSDSPLLGAAAALGVGLLVGLERERRKGRGPGQIGRAHV